MDVVVVTQQSVGVPIGFWIGLYITITLIVFFFCGIPFVDRNRYNRNNRKDPELRVSAISMLFCWAWPALLIWLLVSIVRNLIQFLYGKED